MGESKTQLRSYDRLKGMCNSTRRDSPSFRGCRGCRWEISGLTLAFVKILCGRIRLIALKSWTRHVLPPPNLVAFPKVAFARRDAIFIRAN
jgi:hypothetical protein